jgi:hypothetical protein
MGGQPVKDALEGRRPLSDPNGDTVLGIPTENLMPARFCQDALSMFVYAR